MPPRALCLGIVLFWLGFNGWLLYHDLLPRLVPGQPPPYSVDLVEEAQTRRPHIDWTVKHDGRGVLRARTQVTNPATDVYELEAEFTAPPGTEPAAIHGFLVQRMTSRYRVNSGGDLLGLEVEAEARPQLDGLLKLVGGLLGGASDDIRVQIDGDVEAGRLTLRLRAARGGRSITRNLPAVKLPVGGSVLLPMHPVNRLRGLRPGQAWNMRVLDPLAAVKAALLGEDPDLALVRARVRPEIEPLDEGPLKGRECLVIDYEGDVKASTWVAKERGLVLCQEATLDNQRWAMYRDRAP